MSKLRSVCTTLSLILLAASSARAQGTVKEDGASDWPTFATKAEKLLTQDKVAIVLGGWTSASRKSMLPVFETRVSRRHEMPSRTLPSIALCGFLSVRTAFFVSRPPAPVPHDIRRLSPFRTSTGRCSYPGCSG
ncbi:transporter substrate-binding protein [Deinococcus sp. 6YEL10]|uniref:transporter substrate-binding protein n=1 Tax=Deinococcus sp. 6YEL10 TaxID=2745870 RepID=UPI001E382EC9|nr:transporter substrate-binding protein [Deinococcus sp. 6YEL10]